MAFKLPIIKDLKKQLQEGVFVMCLATRPIKYILLIW